MVRKQVAKFNVTPRIERDADKNVVGWSISCPLSSVPNGDRLRPGTRTITFEDNEDYNAFKQLKDMGFEIPPSYYSCEVEVGDKNVVFRGPREETVRHSLAILLQEQVPDSEFRFVRSWSIRLYKDEASENNEEEAVDIDVNTLSLFDEDGDY